MKSAIAAMATGLMQPNSFHIAPMQCYTNQPLRKLYSYLSPTSIKWTEMEKVNDLLPNTEVALNKRLVGEEDDTNLILQLGSNDVDKLHNCVHVASKHYHNLKEINLNCGCPAIDTGGAPTYGASLMKDALHTSQLVEAMVSATDIDVSVKCRVAVFDTAEDVALQIGEERYEYLHNYISTIHNAGANHVILHARPAILSLSPVKNRVIPQLNYDFVHRVAADFDGKIKITLNGGINSIDQLRAIQNDETNISSHMSGRWCLRRPLDLIEVERTLGNVNVPDVLSAITRYFDYASENKSRFTTGELCLPLYLVISQLQEDYELEDGTKGLLPWKEIETLHDLIKNGLTDVWAGDKVKVVPSSINFKKLAASFGPLVGKKVVNKWKRNRTEF